MKAIGGFLELEIPSGKMQYHSHAVSVATGRTGLLLILQLLRPSQLWVPYYTCDALLQPIKYLNIKYEFYSVNDELIPRNLPELSDNDFFLYINYFGLCGEIVDQLTKIYQSKLIIDNTQAFFEVQYAQSWSFNSARKYCGVPDGGYVYQPRDADIQLPQELPPFDAFEVNYLIDRLIGKQAQSYAEFVAYEKALDKAIEGKLFSASLLSERLLSSLDYHMIAERRRLNYLHYHSSFSFLNHLDLRLGSNAVPLVYPLLLDHPIDRTILFNQNIFVPTYWKDTLERQEIGFESEKEFTKCLLPLPLDQRYSFADCDRVTQAVMKLLRAI